MVRMTSERVERGPPFGPKPSHIVLSEHDARIEHACGGCSLAPHRRRTAAAPPPPRTGAALSSVGPDLHPEPGGLGMYIGTA